MSETSRASSTERELADTVGSASPTGRDRTGDADAPARALLEASPTVASSPAGPVGSTSSRAGDLLPGTVLDNHYRVLRVLGRGGMGTVYLVEHVRLGRKFAAKVIADALAGDEVLVARLHAEARVASRLRHENIVDVTHLGQTPSGALFVVMELLEGQDLRALLDEAAHTNGLPFERARAIAADLFAGLAAAHAEGVVHRDLKPDNVFLARTERGVRAKIVDFGIAKSREAEHDVRLTRTGQVIGTPLYMSPEQSRDTASVDHRADQYSLGVVFFEVLTGHRPFDARNVYELVVMHATQKPRPLRVLRADVPPAVEAVVLRTLEKAPGDRFPDIAALRAAWDLAWESGAREVSASERLASAPTRRDDTAPRRWWLAAVLGGALVGGGGLGLVALVAGPDTRTPEPPRAGAEPDAGAAPTDAAVASPDARHLPLARDTPAAVHRVHTRPEGATLTLADGPSCTTPCDVTIPAGGSIRVTARLAGHRRADREIGASDPEDITIVLAPSGGASRPPALAPR